MSKNVDRFYIVTGGPGSGKSAALNALRKRGCAISIEAGRGVIQEQVAISGEALPWKNPALFAELMLGWEMRNYRMAEEQPGIVIFDRGVPDILGYLRLMNIDAPSHVITATHRFRYNPRVFIAPPWPEIFEQDAERKQDVEEAERTYEAMVTVYAELGYALIELPRLPVEERAVFMMSRMNM
ncbi:MAG: AAA family ATPase [Phyllobacterium sp.]